MRIERVTEPDEALVDAFARLLPQLSPGLVPPTLEALAEMCAAPGTHLLVARDDDGGIVGTLTLLLYRVPAGMRGWIHDVVVDESARGRGLGEALTVDALRRARDEGVERVSLTSRPHRQAAHRLYERLGFAPHETNVYVWRAG